MAYDQNIQRICAKKPHTLMKKDKCLWQDAPDLVNKLPTVMLVTCTLHTTSA